MIYDLMNEKVFRVGTSNRPLLNDLLRVITSHYSNVTGSLYFGGNIFDNMFNFQVAGFDADVILSVSDVLLQNLDSVGDPLDLFRPVKDEESIIDNMLSFGVDSRPLNVSAKMLIAVTDGGK